MADLNTRIILKGSATSGEVPQSSDLQVAEVAVNTADGKLFVKHSDNTIKEISGSGAAGGALGDLSDVTTQYPDTYTDLGQWDNNVQSSLPAASGEWRIDTSGSPDALEFYKQNQAGTDQSSAFLAIANGDDFQWSANNVDWTTVTAVQDSEFSTDGGGNTVVKVYLDDAEGTAISAIAAGASIYFRAITVGLPAGDGDILVYNNADGEWQPSSPAAAGIPEAPQDGKQYARKDAAWEEVDSASRIQDQTDFELNTTPIGDYLYNNYKGSSGVGATDGEYSSGSSDVTEAWMHIVDADGTDVTNDLASLPNAGLNAAVLVSFDDWATSLPGSVERAKTLTSGVYYWQIEVPGANFSTGPDFRVVLSDLQGSLVDVPLAEGDILQWDNTDQKFKPAQPFSGSYNDLTDVPADADTDRIQDQTDFDLHQQATNTCPTDIHDIDFTGSSPTISEWTSTYDADGHYGTAQYLPGTLSAAKSYDVIRHKFRPGSQLNNSNRWALLYWNGKVAWDDALGTGIYSRDTGWGVFYNGASWTERGTLPVMDNSKDYDVVAVAYYPTGRGNGTWNLSIWVDGTQVLANESYSPSIIAADYPNDAPVVFGSADGRVKATTFAQFSTLPSSLSMTATTINQAAVDADLSFGCDAQTIYTDIPLADGDILQWDNADQKFKPAQLPDNELPSNNTGGQVLAYSGTEWLGADLADLLAGGSTAPFLRLDFEGTGDTQTLLASGMTTSFPSTDAKWGSGGATFSRSSADYLQGSWPSAIGTQLFSFAFWFKTSDTVYNTNTNRRIIAPVSGSNLSNGFQINRDTPGGTMWTPHADNAPGALVLNPTGVASGYRASTRTAVIDDDQWHYIVFQYEGSGVYSCFVDGNLAERRTGGIIDFGDNGGFFLGKRSDNTAEGFFTGSLDNVVMYVGSVLSTGLTVPVPTGPSGAGIDNGSGVSIDSLEDVSTSTASDGEVLTWNATNSQWQPVAPAALSTATNWSVTANGTSDYIFAGDGFAGTETDPVLYVMRGQTYTITNVMGAHPFQIQSTSGVGGTAYSDGITNNAVSNGTLTWEVRLDAPSELYYQCTSHSDMGGTIQVLDNSGGGGGGATSLDDLTDVSTTVNPPSDGDYLRWNGTASQFEPVTISSVFGGIYAGGIPDVVNISSAKGYLFSGRARTIAPATSSYDPTDTSNASWDANYADLSTFKGIGWESDYHIYVTGVGTTGYINQSGNYPTVFPYFDLNWTMEVFASNGCWTSDNSDFDLEFLDTNSATVCAIRVRASGNYKNSLQYGANLNSMVYASTCGNYPRVQGELTFTPGRITYTDTRQCAGNGNVLDWYFDCDMGSVTQVQLTYLHMQANWTGDCSATMRIALI